MTDQTGSVLGGLELDALRGRRFWLVPLGPEHHRQLYHLTITDQNSFRWRYHGLVPSPEHFERSLYAGVLCQFAVVPVEQPKELMGLVVAYNSNLQHDYCFLAVIGDRSVGAGILEAVALFLRYLIRHWPFRKIYLEVPEYNAPQFASAVTAGLLKEEGRFLQHQYFLNQYWDLITYAVYPQELLTFGERFSSLINPGPP